MKKKQKQQTTNTQIIQHIMKPHVMITESSLRMNPGVPKGPTANTKPNQTFAPPFSRPVNQTRSGKPSSVAMSDIDSIRTEDIEREFRKTMVPAHLVVTPQQHTGRHSNSVDFIICSSK